MVSWWLESPSADVIKEDIGKLKHEEVVPTMISDIFKVFKWWQTQTKLWEELQWEFHDIKTGNSEDIKLGLIGNLINAFAWEGKFWDFLRELFNIDKISREERDELAWEVEGNNGANEGTWSLSWDENNVWRIKDNLPVSEQYLISEMRNAAEKHWVPFAAMSTLVEKEWSRWDIAMRPKSKGESFSSAVGIWQFVISAWEHEARIMRSEWYDVPASHAELMDLMYEDDSNTERKILTQDEWKDIYELQLEVLAHRINRIKVSKDCDWGMAITFYHTWESIDKISPETAVKFAERNPAVWKKVPWVVYKTDSNWKMISELDDNGKPYYPIIAWKENLNAKSYFEAAHAYYS